MRKNNLTLINQNQEVEANYDEIKSRMNKGIKQKMQEIDNCNKNLDFLANKVNAAKSYNRTFLANLQENKGESEVSPTIFTKTPRKLFLYCLTT